MALDKQLIKRIYRMGGQGSPTSVGLGLLHGRYCLDHPRFAAHIEALGAVYRREHFQQHRGASFAAFDAEIERQRKESQASQERCSHDQNSQNREL